MSKTARISPARTERARKAALAEVRKGTAALDAPHAPHIPPAGEPAAVVARKATPIPAAHAAAVGPVAGSPVPPKAKKAKQPKAKAPKAPKPKKDRPMSGLDAAAKVLTDAGKPMRMGEVMEVITKRGLWKSSGKTPGATLYAAVIREIAAKGVDARFEKKDRGLFIAGKGA